MPNVARDLTWAGPEYIRKQAAKWELVAEMALAEGDKRDAISAKIHASDLRQLARKKEVDAS